MRNRLIISLLLFLPLLFGCTRNNGGEPLLYGSWKVTDVQFQNCQSNLSEGYTWFWAFQNTTMSFTWTNDNLTAYSRYANYRLADNTLFIDFAEQTPVMGLPKQCEMEVLHIGGGRLELLYHPSDDSAIIYKLTKW